MIPSIAQSIRYLRSVSRRRVLLSLPLLIIPFALSGCDFLDQIAKLLDDSKGDRPITFLVMEPYKVVMDGETVSKKLGFDTETEGLEKSFRDGVKAAANGRSWSVTWYKDRDPLNTFYSDIVLKGSPKDQLRAWMSSVRSQPGLRNCEAMIFTLVETDVDTEATHQHVQAFCYDIAENKIVPQRQSVPRDQGSTKFQEQVGKLTCTLCEKMYGQKN